MKSISFFRFTPLYDLEPRPRKTKESTVKCISSTLRFRVPHKKNNEKYNKVPLDVYGGLTGMRRAGGMAGCWKGAGRLAARQARRSRADGPGRTGQVGHARTDKPCRTSRADGPGLTGQGWRAMAARETTVKRLSNNNNIIAKKSDRLFSITDQVTSAGK